VVVSAAHSEEAAREIVLTRVDDHDFLESVKSREMALAAEERAVRLLVADAVSGKGGEGEFTALWVDGGEIDDQAWSRLREMLAFRAGQARSELTHQPLLARQRALCRASGILRRQWDGMGLHERRSVIEAVVDHFVVLPALRGRSNSASERLRPVWRS